MRFPITARSWHPRTKTSSVLPTDCIRTEEQYYYGLLSYSEEDGFVPGAYLNITQSGLFDDALTNTEYRTMRGIYISDTFYLVTENGISSYDMTDGYKLTDTLLWES